MLALPIHWLELSTKTHSTLLRAAFDTVEKLTSLTIVQLAALRNIGPAATREIIRALRARALSLRVASEVQTFIRETSGVEAPS